MPSEETEKFRCKKCGQVYDTAQGLAIHAGQKHGKKNKFKESVEKKPKKMSVPVIINFCSHCGTRIPNAFMIGGPR